MANLVASVHQEAGEPLAFLLGTIQPAHITVSTYALGNGTRLGPELTIQVLCLVWIRVTKLTIQYSYHEAATNVQHRDVWQEVGLGSDWRRLPVARYCRCRSATFQLRSPTGRLRWHLL